MARHFQGQCPLNVISFDYVVKKNAFSSWYQIWDRNLGQTIFRGIPLQSQNRFKPPPLGSKELSSSDFFIHILITHDIFIIIINTTNIGLRLLWRNHGWLSIMSQSMPRAFVVCIWFSKSRTPVSFSSDSYYFILL